MQPLTTNESTQTHSLICHTCNERIPAMLPYTAVNVHINTHTRTHAPTHTQTSADIHSHTQTAMDRGEMWKEWHSFDSNALKTLHTEAA